MAAENYAASLKHVLVHEGGYVNHPADPGGETNKGVTIAVYRGYRQRKGLTPQSVRYISDAELNEIYRLQYWNAIRGDTLPRGVDYVVFDGAVNSGPSQSVKWLQAALGCRVDGNMGEATIAAIEAVSDYTDLIADICARRMAFLRSLRTWGTFGTGWTRRVSGVKSVGIGMVQHVPVRMNPPPLIPEKPAPKAMPTSIAKPDTAENIRDGGFSLGALTEVANQLMPFQDYSHIIRYAVVGLMVLAAVAAIYAIIRKRRVSQVETGEATATVPDMEQP
jgi:lysozyme family protein